MAGNLQPLDQKFALVKPNGTPTDYFIRWAQQRQIDIQAGITAEQAVEIIRQYLEEHTLQEGSGIQITPSGDISDDPTISAEVQAILDQITTVRGSILFRGAAAWEALAPGSAGNFLKTNGAGADPVWAAGGGGGGGSSQSEAGFNYPDLTAFTWFQQGGSTVIADAIGSAITWANGVNIRSLTTPIPAIPFDVYGRFSWTSISGVMHAGLCLKQSANNKHIGVNIIPNTNIYVQSYDGNSFDNNWASIDVRQDRSSMWFRIRVNATNNIDFYVSHDGILWEVVATAINPLPFLTVDRMGIWMRCDAGIPIARVSYFDTALPTA